MQYFHVILLAEAQDVKSVVEFDIGGAVWMVSKFQILNYFDFGIRDAQPVLY